MYNNSDVDCGLLLPPTNGEVIFNETGFNSVATYECNEGFEFNGASVRTCQSDEQWSGSEPFCEGKGRSSYAIKHCGS